MQDGTDDVQGRHTPHVSPTMALRRWWGRYLPDTDQALIGVFTVPISLDQRDVVRCVLVRRSDETSGF